MSTHLEYHLRWPVESSRLVGSGRHVNPSRLVGSGIQVNLSRLLGSGSKVRLLGSGI